MEKTIVSFIELEPINKYTLCLDTFQLRSDRSLVWLQKICFLILKKIKAYTINQETSFKRHCIKPGKFMETLFRQKESIRATFNLRPKDLFIGSEDYQELMGGEEINNIINFHSEYNIGREIMGLRVTIVPWMRGIIVVPPHI